MRPLAPLALVAVLLLASMGAMAQGFDPSLVVNADEGNQRFPDIAIGDLVHVVWVEYDTPRPGIYYANSTNGTFSAKVLLSDGGTGWSAPSIALSDGSPVVAWVQASVSNSTMLTHAEHGEFTAPMALPEGGPGDASSVDVAVVNGTAIVVWDEGQAIYSASAERPYTSFTDPVRVDDSAEGIQLFPRVAADGSTAIVAWHDSRDGMLEVYCSYTTDAGGNFSAGIKVSDSSLAMDEKRPDVAMFNGTAAITWQRGSSIRLAMSDDLASGFGASVQASDPVPDTKADPRVAMDDGGIHLVFRDYRERYPHIYYTLSRTGISFTPDIRVDDDPANSSLDSPAIALGVVPMVVYESITGGDKDIRVASMVNEPPSCLLSPPSGPLEGNVTIIGTSSDPEGSLLHTEVRLSGEATATGWLLAGGEDWNLTVDTLDLLNGEYLLEARAFDGNSYSEMSSANVEVSNALPHFPDLVVSMTIPEEVHTGETMGIDLTVGNTGGAGATFDLEVSLNAVLLHRTTIDLQAGGSMELGVNWTATEGTQLLTASVDPEDQLLEIDEANNHAVRQFQVTTSEEVYSDLMLSADDIVFVKVNGSDMVSITMHNNGTLDLLQAAYIVLLDGNEVQGTVDIVAGESAEIVIPLDGAKEVNVTLDPFGIVDERDESNNHAEAVVPGEGSDMTIYIVIAALAIVSVSAYYLLWRRMN
jgi:hypothetical protein